MLMFREKIKLSSLIQKFGIWALLQVFQLLISDMAQNKLGIFQKKFDGDTIKI